MKKKDKERETVFDHGITEEEMEQLFLKKYTKEEYLEDYLPSADLVLICKLYKLRGDEKKMMEYYNKIPGPEYEKIWLIMKTCYEVAEEYMKKGKEED